MRLPLLLGALSLGMALPAASFSPSGAAVTNGLRPAVAGPGATAFRRAALRPRTCNNLPTAFGGGGGGGGGVGLRGGGGGGGGGDDDGDKSGIMGYWTKYLELLEEKPFVTRMATGLIIGLFGDMLSQAMAGSKVVEMDIKRMVIFSCWGGFGFTPIAYKWYNLIEATIPVTAPGRALWKMAMDQVLFPPAITALTFMTLTVVEGLFSGFEVSLAKGLRGSGVAMKSISELLQDGADTVKETLQDGADKVKETLKPTLITNYKTYA
ncbi:hypothetical protein T484DRAFT_1774362 [Baffinella frigidus]|nr:hypothetical protein T484DRAFT_1774362 [Cryptophyta sp. CCMP2293]